MSRRRRVGWWWWVHSGDVLGTSPVAAWCCNVPVFRYALENWQPDSYQVLVLSRGELNEAQQRDACVDWRWQVLTTQRPANLQVHAIDLRAGSVGGRPARSRATIIRPSAPIWNNSTVGGRTSRWTNR